MFSVQRTDRFEKVISTKNPNRNFLVDSNKTKACFNFRPRVEYFFLEPFLKKGSGLNEKSLLFLSIINRSQFEKKFFFEIPTYDLHAKLFIKPSTLCISKLSRLNHRKQKNDLFTF